VRNPRLLSLSLVSAAALAALACDGAPSPAELEPDAVALAHHGDAGAALSADALQDVAALRQATAAAHNLDHAAAAGWDTAITGCLSSPDGGMGVHMANLSLFDDMVEVTQPEVLVYEPMKNGRLRLVAVEYIVPFDAHPADAEPPTAFGMDFHANMAVGIWALHAWVWKDNPSGMFADWNPNVTCDWAD
jgi:hypothetical protein